MFQQLQEVSEAETGAFLYESNCTFEMPLPLVLLLSPTVLLAVSLTLPQTKSVHSQLEAS
jgi:hypothetical protein